MAIRAVSDPEKKAEHPKRPIKIRSIKKILLTIKKLPLKKGKPEDSFRRL
jgi:hypothetical protein